ncbi:hypothetical protein [Hamadaea tsunoensis]|uniref:hypothetical protein n=1 Tax=Hamadaea tsunoensis TaxID=53368 RepID=UPI00040A261C|nr:hypothetical protein [Hamadaea tsunoensis]
MAMRLLNVVGAVLLAAGVLVPAVPAFADNTTPPGLTDATVQALGVMDTSRASVAGIHSYRMHLWVGGDVYAVPGGDSTIVAILKNGFRPSESVIFRSGPYIIFAPSFLDVPSAVLVPGKENGLEAVDPNSFRCADPTIPGIRFC